MWSKIPPMRFAWIFVALGFLARMMIVAAVLLNPPKDTFPIGLLLAVLLGEVGGLMLVGQRLLRSYVAAEHRRLRGRRR